MPQRQSLLDLVNEQPKTQKTGIIVQKENEGYLVQYKEKQIKALSRTGEILTVGTNVIISEINGISYITDTQNLKTQNVVEVNVDG